MNKINGPIKLTGIIKFTRIPLIPNRFFDIYTLVRAFPYLDRVFTNAFGLATMVRSV